MYFVYQRGKYVRSEFSESTIRLVDLKIKRIIRSRTKVVSRGRIIQIPNAGSARATRLRCKDPIFH
jgi:hypothetical protein